MGFARRRPVLGTFITISCHDGETPSRGQTVDDAFTEAARLQTLFSAIDPESCLNRYNASAGKGREWPHELTDLIARALEVRKASEGSFEPYSEPGLLDLSGIAKGAVVDRLVDFILARVADFNGVVNAGGDLRFLGSAKRLVTARVGRHDHPVEREILLQDPHSAFATSSPTVADNDERSSTRYRFPLAPGISRQHTACVAAPEAWIADALTKVALHAPDHVAERVAREYGATIVLFDGAGEMTAMRGERVVER